MATQPPANFHIWQTNLPRRFCSKSDKILVVVVLRSPIHANEPSEYNGMLYRTSNRVLNNGIKVIILICIDGTSQYHHHQNFLAIHKTRKYRSTKAVAQTVEFARKYDVTRLYQLHFRLTLKTVVRHWIWIVAWLDF